MNSLEQVLDAFVMELAKSGQRLTLWEAWKHLTKKTALEVDLKVNNSAGVKAFIVTIVALCLSDTAANAIGVPRTC